MTPPPLRTDSSWRGSALVGTLAVLAGIAGLTLVVFAVVGLARSFAEGRAATATTGVPTTDVAPTSVAATTVPDATSPSTPPGRYQPYSGEVVTVTDDSGSVSVSVPVAWSDVAGPPWSVDGDTVGLGLGAAVDRDAWYSGWGTPGMFLGITTVGRDSYQPELGDFSGSCTASEVEDRSIGDYAAQIRVWTGCGVEGSTFHAVLARPATGSHTVLAQVVTTDDTGSAVVATILTTLRYEP